MFLKFTPAFCVVLCFVHCVRQRVDLLVGEATRGDGKRKVTSGFCSFVLAFKKTGVGRGHQVVSSSPSPTPTLGDSPSGPDTEPEDGT